MPAEAVRKLLDERLRLGRDLEQSRLPSSAFSTFHGNEADDFLAALSKWSSTTETAIDNFFVGSKTLNQFKAASFMGIGIVYESMAERVDDALDRHRRRIQVLESIIEGLPYMREAIPYTEPVSRPQPTWTDRPVTIHLQSGNVNFGTVMGDVTSNVSGLTGPGAEAIKTLMGRLVEAVRDADLEPETKEEAAESVEVLSEALKPGRSHKPSAMLRSAIRRIPVLLQTADQALRVWTELQGLLGPHLPPGTF